MPFVHSEEWQKLIENSAKRYVFSLFLKMSRDELDFMKTRSEFQIPGAQTERIYIRTF